jgi:glycosyltransferase involved in cell wall biosynthesis
MITKKKLLIVSAISPFPKTSGGAVRIYNTIKYLSQEFELYFIFFVPQNFILNNEELFFLKEKTKFFTHVYQKPRKDYFSFINEFQPYWFSDWINDELKIFLPKIIKQFNINNVQIDCTQLLYLHQYIPENVKSIFVAYDISAVSFWRRLCEVRNPINFFFYFFRWIQIMFYEKFYLPKFDVIVVMSDNDKKILNKNFKVKRILVQPNGVDEINFLEKKADKVIKLGYIGSFNHPPNKTAISYFINKIAPQLEKNRIMYKYFIAGDNNQEDIKAIISHSDLKNEKNIINLGKVKEVKDFYRNIDILIAPIFSGSGTRIKIIEALSFGVPVITTTIGAEGININNQYLSITNSKNEFIKEVVKFFKNPKKNESELTKLKNSIQPLLWKNIFENYFHLI